MVEWSDEAREALALLLNGQFGSRLWGQVPTAEQIVYRREARAILAALTPHVEVMVWEARAEGVLDGMLRLAGRRCEYWGGPGHMTHQMPTTGEWCVEEPLP